MIQAVFSLANLVRWRRYEWRKVHLVYATNGQSQVAGRHTCQLMMKSMVEFIKKQPNFTFGTFDVETTVPEDYAEALKDHVGNWYGGKSDIRARNCVSRTLSLLLLLLQSFTRTRFLQRSRAAANPRIIFVHLPPPPLDPARSKRPVDFRGNCTRSRRAELTRIAFPRIRGKSR